MTETHETTQTTQEAPLRYCLHSDLWMVPPSSGCIARSLDEVVDHIRTEVQALEDGDTVVLTVTVKRMTDAELDALPEWTGP